MKWLFIVPVLLIGVLALFFFGGKVYYALVVNERVTKELHENPESDRAQIVMLLTFPDGKQMPVNYLREGNQVFVGADGGWWKSFRDGNVPVKVFIKGEELSGRAKTILDDPEYTRDIFTRLRPNVPKWLPDWLNAYLIVIDLDD